MPQKPHRGFKTGNSIQKYPSRAIRRKNHSHDDGAFILTTSSDETPSPVTVLGSVIDFSVPYSLKKRKRWLLPDFLRDRLEAGGGLFKDENVNVVECELDCYQRVRPTSLDLREAGEDATLQHIEGRGAFVNCRGTRKKKNFWYESDSDDEEEPRKKKNDVFFDFLHVNPRLKVVKKHWKRIEDEEGDMAYKRWLIMLGLARENRDPEDWPKKKHQKHSSFDLDMLLSDFDAIDADARREAALDRDEGEGVDRQTNLQLSDCIVSINKSPKRKVRKRLHSENFEEKSKKDRKVFNLEPKEETKKEEEEAKKEEEEEAKVEDSSETSRPAVEQVTSALRVLEDPGSSVPVRVTFPTEQLTPSALLSRFADSYMESESLPRKFAIRLTPATEDCSFLIFEEVRANERETLCDAFLNVDVSDVDPHCLTHLQTQFSDANLDLASFVFLCVQRVSETFEGRFERRDGTPVVLFHQKPSPLKHREPTIEEVPLTRIHQPPSPTSAISKAEEHFGTCDICFEEVALGAGDLLDERQEASCLRSCGHLFCTSCWRHHLATSIRQGHLRLRCPASECSAEVDAITALRFVSLPLFALLARQQAADSLLRDPHVALCPNLACRRPVRSEHLPGEGEAMDIACVCQDRFCFSCREEAHWPASCRMYRFFKAKMVSLGDWSLHQSKMMCVQGKCCPACGRFIEKNGGCNSMVCLCGLDFCWQCSMPISDHDEYENGVCGSLEGREVKPTDLQNTDLVYSFCFPDAKRPRSYCAALKLRMDRLRHGNARQLDAVRIRELLYSEKLVKTKGCPFDRAHWSAVMQEAKAITHSYTAMLRVAEFCHVLCFALEKTEDCWPFVKQVGESLEQLATRMRQVIEEKPLGGSETRVGLVRTVLQQAQRQIGFMRSLRVLSEPLRSEARSLQRVR